MEQLSDKYKIKIDKEVLTDFFLNDQITDKHLSEIRKVFNVVLIKHYSKYSINADELFQYAITAILERRDRYDQSFSAYNYIFTCFRNEVGNKINKLSREQLLEDILSFKESISTMEGTAELPLEISKYKDMLIGVEDFTIKRITKSDVLNLILFLRLYESKRQVKIPTFLEEHRNATQVLYKTLKELTGL